MMTITPADTLIRKATGSGLFVRFVAGAVLVAGLGLAGLGLTGLGATASAQDSDAGVIARIDGVDITQEDLDMARADIGQSMPQMSEEQQRDYLVTYLADLMLVAKAAEQAGVADEPEFVKRLNYMRDRSLMEAYLVREGEAASTDEAAQALYEEVIAQVPEEPRIRARHILVDSEDEAKEIKAALDGGADFGDIAKEKSTDPGSGADGGDLGWFTKEEMVPAFANAAFALEPGEVSEPVKSDFGWHIIKAEGKRNKPGFDEVEGEINEMLRRRRQQEIISGLRDAADIEKFYDVAGEDAGSGDGEKKKKNRKKKDKDATMTEGDADAADE